MSLGIAGLGHSGLAAATVRASGGSAKGVALTIGLNAVDPARYAGWDGKLNACEADAEDVAEIAEKAGFQVKTLKTREATRKAVLDTILATADALKSGDIFLLQYSGHGGQLPDANGDELEDGEDETWCLYDGELVDDELFGAWAKFKPGVRIFVLSDSCHSGTVTKDESIRGYEAVILAGSAGLNTDDRSKAMGQIRQEAGAASPNATRGNAGAGESRAALFRVMPNRLVLPDRTIENLPMQVYRQNKRMYDPILETLSGGDAQEIKATVLLISGCQDNQVSLDGTFNGLFTGKLKRYWDRGRFQGNYRQFHRVMLRDMPATQSPNYFVIGAPNPEFEAQKPFTI